MARVRILRRQNSGYMELPKELSACDEVELFQLREGYYLLSIPLPAAGAAEAGGNRKQEAVSERSVLKKLMAIRFENRTPANVDKLLSGPEKEALRELEEKRLVNVFRGTKYRDGVYNISDAAYAFVRSEAKPGMQDRKPEGEAAARPAPDPYGLLGRGFMILADRNEARAMSDRLSDKMKAGAVVGVKGFDGKFYVVTKEYFNKAQSAIAGALKEPMDCDSIAAAARLDPDGCRAVLRLMAENGDVIEKKKGIFAAV